MTSDTIARIIDQNLRAATIDRDEIRQLFSNHIKRSYYDRRRHDKQFTHAERRVRSERRA